MATYDPSKLTKLKALKELAEQVRDNYATKTELSALSTKVEGLVSTGGEPNKIEKIKVNGTEQTITEKEVDIKVPTKVGDLDNDQKFQTESEVKKAVSDAFKEFEEDVSDDSAVNTYKELIEWAAEHSSDAAEIIGKVNKLEGDLDDKVDKNGSKQLSDENYTADEKNKLSGISTGANKVEKSNTNGNIKIDGAETQVYVHPTATQKDSGFYKITVDATGHVTGATAVEKGDITALGILDAEIASDEEVTSMLTEVFGASA